MFLVAQAGQLFGDTEAAALPALLESGRLPARISGLPASARALLAASMHAQLDAPVLAVCPDEAAAELFQKDLSALLGQDVPLLTARDYTFYTVESVSRQTEQKRLSALYALAAGTAPAVVCTVSGLLQRAMPKEKLLQAAFEIRDGSSLPPEDAEDALLRCGYLRTAQVEGAGQFSRRGGILDFFSPAYPQPVRVEFWGDDVDSMGFFDPESQRRTQPLESCRILPAAATLPPLYPGGSAALGEKLQKLAGRAAAGSLTGENVRNIPASLRFYSGGGGSVRGYKYQSLGPHDRNGDPLGGLSFTDVSLEARFRITESFGIVPFVDGGMVYETTMPDWGRDLSWGVGLGFRYYTLIGPIRLDIATPLQDRDNNKAFQIYLSIGQAF